MLLFHSQGFGFGSREGGGEKKTSLPKNVEFAANQTHEKRLNKEDNFDEEKWSLGPWQVASQESQPWVSPAAALQRKLGCWAVAFARALSLRGK